MNKHWRLAQIAMLLFFKIYMYYLNIWWSWYYSVYFIFSPIVCGLLYTFFCVLAIIYLGIHIFKGFHPNWNCDALLMRMRFSLDSSFQLWNCGLGMESSPPNRRFLLLRHSGCWFHDCRVFRFLWTHSRILVVLVV